MDAKLLSESAWRTMASKFKLKDNGLQKALADYQKIEEDEHDELLESIEAMRDLASEMKKSREAAANSALAKYLGDMLNAIQSEQREIAKAKAEAHKARAAADKAKAEAERAEAEAEKAEAKARKMSGEDSEGAEEEEEEDEEEEEQGEYEEQLKAAFQKLRGAKDTRYQFIVCDAKPHCAVMIAKKIGAKHKAQLTKVTGSKRFLRVGTCGFEDGHFVFTMDEPVSGLARRLQSSVKNFTGKRYPISIGDESTDDDESSEESSTDNGSSTGRDRGDDSSNAGDDSDDSDSSDSNASSSDDNSSTTQESDTAMVSAPGQTPRPHIDIPPPTGEATAATPAPGQQFRPPPMPASGSFSISGSVGRGGKNKPEDVQAVQNALNSKANAGLVVDGKCGPKTIAAIMAFQKTIGQFKPDGLVDVGRGTSRALAGSAKVGPPPAPPQPIAPPKLPRASLPKAPAVWHNMRNVVDTNVKTLKKAVQGHYANEHPDLLKEIDEKLQKLDAITEKLDHRIADSMTKAHAASDDAARKAELKKAKAILAEYIQFVKAEPLIAHIDDNPWVKIELKRTLVETLTHMAQAIGQN